MRGYRDNSWRVAHSNCSAKWQIKNGKSREAANERVVAGGVLSSLDWLQSKGMSWE